MSRCLSLMALKIASMSWLTVYRMVKVNGGFRSPEDIKPSPLDKHPSPDQTAPNAYVDRVRRIHQNDTENIRRHRQESEHHSNFRRAPIVEGRFGRPSRRSTTNELGIESHEVQAPVADDVVSGRRERGLR